MRAPNALKSFASLPISRLCRPACYANTVKRCRSWPPDTGRALHVVTDV